MICLICKVLKFRVLHPQMVIFFPLVRPPSHTISVKHSFMCIVIQTKYKHCTKTKWIMWRSMSNFYQRNVNWVPEHNQDAYLNYCICTTKLVVDSGILSRNILGLTAVLAILGVKSHLEYRLLGNPKTH